MTTYSYTFASFPNGKVSLGKLQQQIEASPITVALDAINVRSQPATGLVDIVFKATLGEADKEALDGSVATLANSATPCPVGSLIGDHDGVQAQQSGIRSDGVQLVQLEPASEAASLRAKGIAGPIAPATIDGTPVKTSFTWSPSEPVSFQGIPWVDVTGSDPRDYMRLSVVFTVDGDTAVFEELFGEAPWAPAPTPAAAGITEPIVLTVFGDTIYVPQSGHLIGEVGEGVSRIVPPLQLVIDYFAHATSQARLAAMIRYWVG